MTREEQKRAFTAAGQLREGVKYLLLESETPMYTGSEWEIVSHFPSQGEYFVYEIYCPLLGVRASMRLRPHSLPRRIEIIHVGNDPDIEVV